ncbi:hypothetical protein G6045_20435 [Streptomyces sp. YC504]|uniref:Uncharacterized protein n=1 Tax=Streptomyces mesophilus TaxID=1775132 RepID=A0A6G4XLF8_9ACTN|nr:hypothetical protein [Streptomyces mesophilus]NGO78012.1 hypothetical protein [Streptomyces mesophilus]
MKHAQRIALAASAVLLGSLATAGAAQAATGHDVKGSDTQVGTVERPAGTDATKAQKIKPADPSNKYSQTVERSAGTDSIPAMRVN